MTRMLELPGGSGLPHIGWFHKYSEDEARDDHGRWTAGGGGDTLTGGGELIGYSSTAYLDADGKLHTSNVDDAVRALGEGQKVVLDQPRQLSTLIQRLAEVAKAAKDAGEKAKDYDLCNVSVPGTNLFCADAKGFTRIEMPQLDGKPIAGSKADALPKNQFGEVETTSQFQQFLKDAGYSVDRETERADYLKATQSELSGVRTASLMGLMQEGKLADSTIFISKDNYIVDGHHRWAAKVGLEFGGGKVLYMNVARVNTDIITLMGQARSFAHTWGIPQVAKHRPRGTYVLAADDAGLPYIKFSPDQPRDDQGKWTSGGAGGSRSVTLYSHLMPTFQEKVLAQVGQQIADLEQKGLADPDNHDYAALAQMDTALDLNVNTPLSQRQNLRVAVAVEGDNIAAAGAMVRRSKTEAEVLHLGSISRGAGRDVLDRLVEEAKAWKVARITLNSTARSFYERAGFRLTSGSKMEMVLRKRRAQA